MSALVLIGAAMVVAVLSQRKRRDSVWWVSLALATVVAALGTAPFSRWSATSLPHHMIAHIVVMFALPLATIVSGVLRFLPARVSGFLGSVHRVHPVVALVALNAVMLTSHVPAVFNSMMQHSWERTWVVDPLFYLVGVWFFSYLITPLGGPPTTRVRWQLMMIASTTAVMTVLAMAMSIFTNVAWYETSGASQMPGMVMGSARDAFHSQQLGAAILWICGDLWAAPLASIAIARLARREGGLLKAFERYAPSSL